MTDNEASWSLQRMQIHPAQQSLRQPQTHTPMLQGLLYSEHTWRRTDPHHRIRTITTSSSFNETSVLVGRATRKTTTSAPARHAPSMRANLGNVACLLRNLLSEASQSVRKGPRKKNSTRVQSLLWGSYMVCSSGMCEGKRAEICGRFRGSSDQGYGLRA